MTIFNRPSVRFMIGYILGSVLTYLSMKGGELR